MTDIERGVMTMQGPCFPELGLRMVMLRNVLGVTQSVLARATGVHQSEVSKFEAGLELHRLHLHAAALAEVLGPEVRQIAALAQRSSRAFELRRRLLQAKVDFAVLTIVTRMALVEKVEADKIMAALTLKRVCTEMGQAVPTMAVEAVPMQVAIQRAIGSLPDLLKGLHAKIDKAVTEQRESGE